MKGSQGLEALAALCGGASKAPDNEPSQQNDCSQQSTQASQLIGNNNNAAGTQSQVSISPQLEHFANSSAAFNRSKGESNVGQQNQALNQINPQVAALLKAGLSQQNISNNIPANDGAMALQQMVYLNLLQNQSNVSNMLNQQQQQQASNQFVDQNALAMVLALQQQQQAVQHEAASSHHFQNQLQQQHHDQQQSQFRAIIPPPTQPNQTTNLTNSTNNGINAQSTFQVPRPKVKAELPRASASNGAPLHQPILMRHPQGEDTSDISAATPIRNESSKANESITKSSDEELDHGESSSFHPEDKKLLKRAANRRSAQLSRKRKKQYIEDLKDENSDLRRMEMILRSIPDLVISFDSSGKIGFVSQSVSRFLSFTPHELEGRSFWDRLCEESVRLLKAAFMDALAAREKNSTTAPLGNGVWELRLQDKNKENVMVTLNGVVHFTGDAPECVCSIRLSDGKRNNFHSPKPTNTVQNSMKPAILPQQSVFNPAAISQHAFQVPLSVQNKPSNGQAKHLAAQISDVESSITSD
jgi:PAS domain-containing protein